MGRRRSNPPPREIETALRLFETWQQPIYAFLRRELRQETDAADLTQEVLITLVGKYNTLHDAANEKAWVYRIARNALSNHRRGHRRAEERLAHVAYPDPTPSSADVAEERDRERRGSTTRATPRRASRNR